MMRIRTRRNRAGRWWVLLVIVLLTLLSVAVGKSGILQHWTKDAAAGQKTNERQQVMEGPTRPGGLSKQTLDYLAKL